VSHTTVADVVVDGLKRAGTPRIFAVPSGGANLPLVEAARAAGLPVTLVSGEAAACIMAAVTGDLVDAPGAVVIGPGPGVAAAVSGVVHGLLDRAPAVVLTSGHPAAVLACKETLRVEPASAAHRIAHATRLAMSEPRGPVHLDISAEVVTHPAVPVATSCRPDPLPYPQASELDAAARALSHASRPLLLVGLHCRTAGAAQWLRALAEALPAPLLTTARAKGALPDPHPLMLGVLGASGVEGRLLDRADLVVGMGLDALEPVPAACWSTAPVLGVGPPQALDDWVPTMQVVGEIGAVIEELAQRLRDKPRADWDVAELDRLRREGAARSAGDGLTTRVVRLAREATPAGTIATVDAGAHHACVVSAWPAVAPREFLTSNGLATAGFALPAAIAAHLVHPGRPVVCFTSTAGLTAASTELETAVRLGAPIVMVVFSDTAPGTPDPVRLAQSFRVTAGAVDSEARFADALARALRASGPAVIAIQGAA
jgi:acetolactate synthase I/II/III large subunit